MIFFGDIASPDSTTTEQLNTVFVENASIFNGKKLIFNFEGAISDQNQLISNDALLFNHRSVPQILKRDAGTVFCLANNHILDLPEAFDNTIDILNKEGIIFCGAGRSKKEACDPITSKEKDRSIVLFNACWDFLLYSQCNPSKGIYIAEINESKLINSVKCQKETDHNASIIVFLHWSLDLETLPFPMYRQFSKDLIDSGASLVIGSHSHCVQGGEKYKNGYIVYGLGNFFIPHSVFIKGRLKYPEFTKMQMVFEWDTLSEEAICHWFKYSHDFAGHKLTHIGSEKFEDSARLKKYSPFQDMSDNEYFDYFRKQRRKRFLIPVYTDYKKKYKNKLLTICLKNRARLAHLLARLNIINWQN